MLLKEFLEKVNYDKSQYTTYFVGNHFDHVVGTLKDHCFCLVCGLTLHSTAMVMLRQSADLTTLFS